MLRRECNCEIFLLYNYPKNKKSPLIQGLDGFNHKKPVYASKKLGESFLSPLKIIGIELYLHNLFFLLGQDIIDL
jgi:hypothetical protein